VYATTLQNLSDNLKYMTHITVCRLVLWIFLPADGRIVLSGVHPKFNLRNLNKKLVEKI
jgi:hypothetical protein